MSSNKKPALKVVPNPDEGGEAANYPVPLKGVYTREANAFSASKAVVVGKRFNTGLTADGVVEEIRMSRDGVVRVTVRVGDQKSPSGGIRYAVIGAGNVAHAEEL